MSPGLINSWKSIVNKSPSPSPWLLRKSYARICAVNLDLLEPAATCRDCWNLLGPAGMCCAFRVLLGFSGSCCNALKPARHCLDCWVLLVPAELARTCGICWNLLEPAEPAAFAATCWNVLESAGTCWESSLGIPSPGLWCAALISLLSAVGAQGM